MEATRARASGLARRLQLALCNQSIHKTTMTGTAIAHARLGLERARRGLDANLEQRLLATIAFLEKCGLEDCP